jgi:hypothetical protein
MMDEFKPHMDCVASAATAILSLQRAVFESKFMLPWAFSEEAAVQKHMSQLQHNIICGRGGARAAT